MSKAIFYKQATKNRWFPPAALTLIVSVFMAPAVFLGEVFFLKDMQLWFYPSMLYWRQRILAGELPTWIPQLEMGKPFLADPSNAALYPLKVITLLPAPYSIGWFLVAHVILATLGAYFLARTFKLQRASSMVAALGFGLGGYVVSMAVFSGTYVLSIAWIPLVAALCLRILERGRFFDSALASIAFGSQILSGEVQGAVFSIVLVLGLWIAKPQTAKERAVSFGQLTLILLMALAIAAPQILPTLELMSGSVRVDGVSWDSASRWSLNPLRLIELVSPQIWGNPVYENEYQGYFLVDDPAGDQRPLWMASPYFGSICVALIFVCLALFKKKDRRWLAALGTVAALMFLIALGIHTPLFRLCWEFVPGFSMFRYPEKYYALPALILPLIAAFGLDAVIRSDKKAPLLVVTVLLALMLVIASLVASGIWNTNREAFFSEAGLLLLIGLSIWLVHKKNKDLQGPVIVAGLTIQLFFANLGLSQTTEPAIYEIVPPLAQEMLKRTPTGEPVRLLQFSFDKPYGKGMKTRAVSRAYSLCNNIGINHKIQYTEAYTAAKRSSRASFWIKTNDFQFDTLNLYSIRFGIAQRMTEVPDHSGLEVFEEFAIKGLVPFENKTAFSFVRPVRQVLAANGYKQALEKLEDKSVRLGLAAVIEGISSSAESTDANPGKCESASRPNGNTIQTRCSLKRPAWVVINESHESNWGATVDGKQVPVHRANAIVMAVFMPAGDHLLQLEYSEPGFYKGLIVSMVVLIILAALLLVEFRKRNV